MNINYIPIIGWLVSFLFSVCLAVPFWFIWNRLHFADIYFYWLPEVYRQVGFWDIVGLFIVISILKTVLLPRFYTDVSTNDKDEK